MSFNTFRRYERELKSTSDNFYVASLRRIGLAEDASPQVEGPPIPGMRWGEKIPDLRIEGAISLEGVEDAVSVGLAVNGIQLTLMMEEATEERRGFNKAVRFEEVGEPAKVVLSVPNSAALGDTTEIEVELTGRSAVGAKAIIRERRAGRLLTETRLIKFPRQGRGKHYLEVTEFGAL